MASALLLVAALLILATGTTAWHGPRTDAETVALLDDALPWTDWTFTIERWVHTQPRSDDDLAARDDLRAIAVDASAILDAVSSAPCFAPWHGALTFGFWLLGRGLDDLDARDAALASLDSALADVIDEQAAHAMGGAVGTISYAHDVLRGEVTCGPQPTEGTVTTPRATVTPVRSPEPTG